jgi:hypothetical protein
MLNEYPHKGDWNMLRSLNKMTGFTVLARDGEVGDVEDFYFDDEGWRLRYLVVDIGKWLPGKKVLISPASFEKPLWDEKKFSVSLTRSQIEKSPGIDTKKPITRQHEMELHQYYDWNPYWLPSVMGMPGLEVPAETREAMSEKRGAMRETAAGDIHLQSLNDIKGWSISAFDGEIGQVDDFLVDEMDWDVRYLILDTSKWLPTAKRVLISPNWITMLNTDDETVRVDLTVNSIKNSPEYDPDRFDREYEEALHRHYGKEGYWSRRKAA